MPLVLDLQIKISPKRSLHRILERGSGPLQACRIRLGAVLAQPEPQLKHPVPHCTELPCLSFLPRTWTMIRYRKTNFSVWGRLENIVTELASMKESTLIETKSLTIGTSWRTYGSFGGSRLYIVNTTDWWIHSLNPLFREINGVTWQNQVVLEEILAQTDFSIACIFFHGE